MSVPPGFRAGWLAKLSHDLRNQLSPMRTATQLLQSGRLDAERQAEMLGLIERQVQRMVRMLDDVSEYGRFGVPLAKRDVLQLGYLLDSAAADVGPRVRAAGHVLDVEIPDTPLAVEGDRGRLVALLVRLLDNAIRFTPPAGHIRLTAREDGDHIEIVVADSGPGVDDSRRAQIFELPEGPRSAEALGISLLLARDTAHLHGGTLDVRTPAAGGSEFVLRLPRVALGRGGA